MPSPGRGAGERDADGDGAIEEGVLVARGAGHLPGDAREAGGDGILRRVGDPDDQGAGLDALGEAGGYPRAEDVLAEEGAQVGELRLGRRDPRHEAHVLAGVEGGLPPGRRVRVEVDDVRGEVAAGVVGEAQGGPAGCGVGVDVEGEDRGHGDLAGRGEDSGFPSRP